MEILPIFEASTTGMSDNISAERCVSDIRKKLRPELANKIMQDNPPGVYCIFYKRGDDAVSDNLGR
ncbi:MAG TPA: hypothetical protein VIH18_06835 [Candidatus Binatia bacterium]|jgi:hypothetical protein